MSSKKVTPEEVIAELLRRPSGKAAYERKTLIVQVAQMVNGWRTEARLTQKELAKIAGTKQSQISRIESYENDNLPGFDTLINIAHACGRKFIFGSQPEQPPRDQKLFHVKKAPKKVGVMQVHMSALEAAEVRREKLTRNAQTKETGTVMPDFDSAELIAV